MTNSAVYLAVLVAIVVIAGSEGHRCPKHQIWSECPSWCPLTCENPKPVDACIKSCQPPGCVCKKGFVLNGKDCVRVQDCKKDERCPLPHQVWSECPSACPETCEKPPTDVCIDICRKPGCVCEKGFVLKGDQCVRKENCDHKCPVNQVWSECPSACPETCEKRPTDVCIQICLKPGCVCKKGFVLKGGKCVRKENCDRKCPANQVWSQCPSWCPKTCENPEPTGPCIEVCQPEGCVCKEGFVLKGKKCVPVKDCKA